MIKVNLIKKKSFRLPIVLGVDLNDLNLKMIVIFLVLSIIPEKIVEFRFNGNVNGINNKLRKLQQEDKALGRKVRKEGRLGKALEAFKLREVQLKSRSKQVEQIVKLKANPKELLEKIARSTPSDIWLTYLEITSEKNMLIAGAAKSYRSIGEYRNSLNNTPYFGGKLDLGNDGSNKVKGARGQEVELFVFTGKVQTFNPFGE